MSLIGRRHRFHNACRTLRPGSLDFEDRGTREDLSGPGSGP
ncbi:hypothetical protein [Streptomyces sp. 5-10]|nr:hypothetical protein [Streptomyces sp. 5-10]